MPRFLWLGLVVCALGLIAALAFVRTIEPAAEIDPEIAAAELGPSDSPVDLAAGHDIDRGDRAPIEAAVSAESAQTLEDLLLAKERTSQRSFARGLHEREPRFESGVIEARVVRDHDGQPLAGVNVALARDGGPDVQTSDSSGAVVFTNVEEGPASLSAILAGHARAVGQSWIARDSPHKNVELRLVVEREVVVRLRDPNGRTFDPAAWQLDRRAANRVGIRLDSRCGRVGSTFEAVDAIQFGSRSAEQDLGPFTWRVRIQGATDVCVHALLDEVIVGVEPLDSLTTELHVRIDPTAIEAALAPVVLRVLAEAELTPIAGALVEFAAGGSRLPTFHTGIDGRVSVAMAAAPSAQLVVTAHGYAAAKITLTRPNPPEVVVRMTPGRRIAGRVVDQDGSPLATARLELRSASGDAVNAPSTRSMAGGRFEFVDVVGGEYRVLASYGGNRVEAKADCRERDATDLEFEIRVPKTEPSSTPR